MFSRGRLITNVMETGVSAAWYSPTGPTKPKPGTFWETISNETHAIPHMSLRRASDRPWRAASSSWRSVLHENEYKVAQLDLAQWVVLYVAKATPTNTGTFTYFQEHDDCWPSRKQNGNNTPKFNQVSISKKCHANNRNIYCSTMRIDARTKVTNGFTFIF